MRIGIDATALPSQPAGAGNYMIHLIRALGSLGTGHEFVVFAYQHGFDLIHTPDLPALSWVLTTDKRPFQRLIWEQTTLPRLVRSSGIELLHSLHYTRPLRLPCRSVVTFHDMTFFLYPQMHTLPKRLFFPLAIRQSARLADAIIAVSESTRQDTIRLLGVPEDKIIAIPNGVGSEFQVISNANLLSEVRSKYHLPDEFILYVGQIEPRKNLPTLLRSYKKLVAMGEKIPLVIVGSFGWMYKNVLREIDALGLEKLVHFTGYAPTEDLSIIYNLARIFVYVSIYEGFGLPTLEAMACGTPVITSAVSSMPEHVGDAGILIPPYDEDALAQAMHLLLNDQALREHLSTKGRTQAAQFTWERAAQETLKVYQRVLEVS